jgi:glucose-6-phosphate dehydrogenase assembly protein OpcA
MALELESVFNELTERARERGSEMSVATMTILVFFEDPAIGELARDRIHTLASKHPSRVIVLDGTQDEGVQRVETPDWIELGVKNSSADVLHSAASALRLRETPLVLLWIAPRIGDDERFCALSPEAQTVVYNSSLVDAGHGALCELVEYVEAHPELPISDIAYLRLAPWQESVATLFDGDEAAELLDLTSVEFGCGSEPEAFYLLGWLASRLGWTPRSAERLVAPSGKQISIAIRREGEPRRVRRVALSSTRSRFLAEMDEDGMAIHLSISGAGRSLQRYRAINSPGIAALVERAILSGQNDRIFQASLAAAGQILAVRPAAS